MSPGNIACGKKKKTISHLIFANEMFLFAVLLYAIFQKLFESIYQSVITTSCCDR